MANLFPITRIDVIEFAAIICLYGLVSALADEARYARARALEELAAELAAAGADLSAAVSGAAEPTVA